MKPYAPAAPTLSTLVKLPKPAAVTRQPKMPRSMKPSPISRLGKWAHPPKGTR